MLNIYQGSLGQYESIVGFLFVFTCSGIGILQQVVICPFTFLLASIYCLNYSFLCRLKRRRIGITFGGGGGGDIQISLSGA